MFTFILFVLFALLCASSALFGVYQFIRHIVRSGSVLLEDDFLAWIGGYITRCEIKEVCSKSVCAFSISILSIGVLNFIARFGDVRAIFQSSQDLIYFLSINLWIVIAELILILISYILLGFARYKTTRFDKGERKRFEETVVKLQTEYANAINRLNASITKAEAQLSKN